MQEIFRQMAGEQARNAVNVSLWSRLLLFRMGTSLGFALFAFSLLLYRSHRERPVFAIWSYPFFALVALTYLGLAFWILRMLSAGRRTNWAPRTKGAIVSFDLGILLWGVAYFISTMEDNKNAGRLTDLNLVGSTVPVAAILEWLALCLWALATLLAIRPKLAARHGNVVVSVAATVFTLLALEGGLRVYLAIFPVTEGFPTYAGELWTRRYVSLNSEGFRDVEHSKVADPSVHRLLVVGDSYAYGEGIKRTEERFGEQLSGRLTRATRESWVSLNASKGGTNTLDHIEFLRKMLLYRPQLVVLLYVFNDIEYLHPVVPDLRASKYSPLGVLYSNSYLFQQIYMLFIRASAAGQADPVTVYEDDQLVSRHVADIKRFVALAEDNGARAFVVPVDPSTARPGGPRPGHRNFVRLAEQAGVPIISTLELFKGVEYTELIVNWLDRHPNERAIGIASASLGDELRRRLSESDNRGPQPYRP
jgi:hypothetical protein